MTLVYNKKTKEYIRFLDSEEQAVLREFFVKRRNNLDLPLEDPVVNGLLKKRLLIRTSEFVNGSISGLLVAMKINEKIKKEIDNPIALGVSHLKDEYEIKKFVNKNRPIWAKDKDKYNSLF